MGNCENPEFSPNIVASILDIWGTSLSVNEISCGVIKRLIRNLLNELLEYMTLSCVHDVTDTPWS